MTTDTFCIWFAALALMLLPAVKGQAHSGSETTLAVFDRSGSAEKRLKAMGRQFVSVPNLAAVPTRAKTLIVGSETLTEAESVSPAWSALLKRGIHLLVLEQSYPRRPLHGIAAPANTWLCEFPATYKMDASVESPLLAGLSIARLNRWPGTDTELRPLYGMLSKAALDEAVDINCKDRLYAALPQADVTVVGRSAVSRDYTPLLLWRKRGSVAILCQMPVGKRLADDSVAQKLFSNMLRFLDQKKPQGE